MKLKIKLFWVMCQHGEIADAIENAQSGEPGAFGQFYFLYNSKEVYMALQHNFKGLFPNPPSTSIMSI